MLAYTLLIGVFTVQQTQAHRGVGGEYGRSTPIYLEGAVTSVFFGYSHLELTLSINQDVQSADGTHILGFALMLDAIVSYDLRLPGILKGNMEGYTHGSKNWVSDSFLLKDFCFLPPAQRTILRFNKRWSAGSGIYQYNCV